MPDPVVSAKPILTHLMLTTAYEEELLLPNFKHKKQRAVPAGDKEKIYCVAPEPISLTRTCYCLSYQKAFNIVIFQGKVRLNNLRYHVFSQLTRQKFKILIIISVVGDLGKYVLLYCESSPTILSAFQFLRCIPCSRAK